MNGIRDLAALAADDAAVEEEIERTGGNALRLGLHAYAFHADEDLTPADDAPRAPLPRWFWPINVALLAVAAVALVWR